MLFLLLPLWLLSNSLFALSSIILITNACEIFESSLSIKTVDILIGSVVIYFKC